MEWAREILAAGASFVPADDLAWKRVQRSPWDEGAIGLRTANLLLFTTSSDATVVGACLRNGEGAIRALSELLVTERAPGDVVSPLEIRLHAWRDAYLEEERPDGAYALPWSAGYYSPRESVSRFYVERDSDSHEPLGRSIYKTLVHELTHQYISERWAGTALVRADQPGYWIVEGFARFVEDQVVEMGRTGRRFDDSSVPSLDATAAVAAERKSIPLNVFVDMNNNAFAAFSGQPVAIVQLRNTIVRLKLDDRSVFYEQAGSLVFFLMHANGAEGRTAVVEFLRDFYAGDTSAQGWKRLGFGTAGELEERFAEFLANLR